MRGVNATRAALGTYSGIPKTKNIYKPILEANTSHISEMLLGAHQSTLVLAFRIPFSVSTPALISAKPRACTC